MTRTTKEEINGSALYFLKKAHLIIGIVVVIITQIAAMFGAYYSVKADIRSNTEAIVRHIDNGDVHMTYSTKVREFVPRGEYNDLKDQLNRLETKLDKLINR